MPKGHSKTAESGKKAPRPPVSARKNPVKATHERASTRSESPKASLSKERPKRLSKSAKAKEKENKRSDRKPSNGNPGQVAGSKPSQCLVSGGDSEVVSGRDSSGRTGCVAPKGEAGAAGRAGEASRKVPGVVAEQKARRAKVESGKVPAAGAVQPVLPAAGPGGGRSDEAPAVRSGKLKPTAIPPAKPEVEEEPLPELPKTRLTDEELEFFRQILLEKRRELMGDVATMEDQAMRGSDSAGGAGSSMPIHMADLGSDTWEQEFTLGLIEKERSLVREIDEALERIDQRTYGVCMATGRPITKARLKAKPWAKHCIEYERELEKRRR